MSRCTNFFLTFGVQLVQVTDNRECDGNFSWKLIQYKLKCFENYVMYIHAYMPYQTHCNYYLLLFYFFSVTSFNFEKCVACV